MENLDKETDKYCIALLKELSDANPRRDKEITKRVHQLIPQKEGTLKRRLFKVSIYYVENNYLYENAIRAVNKLPEFISPISRPKVSGFFENIYYLYDKRRISGSFDSKYEKIY